ncbi:undecaprenyldiphospho-muramoylpentapeptide beta-N-acetylglucosaminyltransferase [Lepagella muris]|jgi:UDP-N-acetylglucosamine--N-acetylmuramyl-(pentapeptide) pyrophosphoryl-undecaprenol N-acetylglucosamine transferase|uniref:Undecaprenyldiphospho-muramoylpentapeptide beta-N-acetylglucosaminyltransferase n=1 Tax=Lepagella muris TaxID=3032870 RepID=A0AC61RBD6_9BACT|nr:undecaprenyldiphospho-muramoylpentapeptide beta-N-acetylglucosaminyltransferase [Lepagella muris]ROT02591.1 undecaprenyldiphospho-muramoylpentapeptide beta-N-acetylglucosaminyltransferase [Muribaculaceae bacterium Isolate-037 (Harlan)]TGY76797.1 undecaprenyldiphospho-muramoylpentapeptide beta-N-acetylglucosaminyltransferase [Lepagella muris]THG47912.1 undecaprenyldiphospho-muramoylpentapeptide beta-N-acetylglucosaminyltransferase [Bacteroidales bacterium]TKC54557.1 undecaprenyldiphospho-mura
MKENNTATSCSDRRPRVVISGGGTGGHIFPALSIADALRRRLNADIIFVGAEDRMEMTRVPDAGYRIIGLPVAGFDRKHLLRNISVLKKLCRSMRMAKKVIKDFNPDIAIGVGGYASGPTLKAAQKAGIPTLIQEQNSYAGVTNKLLGKKAGKICVAYDGMERFFPADHIVKTGNPIRKTLLNGKKDTKEARKSFGLDPDKTTLLVVGGSLGALTINESLEKGVKRLSDSGIQVIWQTGKNFGTRGQEAARGLKGVVVTPFITDMSSAYKAADLVIGRAGAGSISELQVLGKPVILVPSPNVAEDHQTHNARALSDRGAAVLIKDSEARDLLVDKSIELIKDKDALASMSAEISKMALHDSDDHIVDEVCRLLNCK